MDGNQNFESADDNTALTAVGGSASAEFNAHAITSCSDTASVGHEEVVTPDMVPLSEQDRFLEAVQSDLNDAYILDRDATICLLGAHGAEKICEAMRIDRMVIGGNGTETLAIVQRLNNDGKVVETSIPAADLGTSSPSGAAILRQEGARIYARDGKFADLLRSFPFRKVEATRVTPGWFAEKPRAFGLSDNQYVVSDKHADAITLVADRHVPDDQMIEVWKAEVGSKLVGNPFALFMMCTALSGPMLDLLKWRGGIFNFAFPTSSAKTTGLIIANHAWRSDAPLSWNHTQASLDDACLSANGTFLALDEVPEDNLKMTEKVVFRACNGVRRGARPAPGQKIEGGGWNVPAASTSEFPVWELAQADASKGKNSVGVRGKPMRIKEGTFVRLIDVGGREEAMWQNLHGSASKGLFLRSIETCSAESAGTIGPAYIYRLLNNHELLEWDLPLLHTKFMKSLAKELSLNLDDDDGAKMRVMGHFAAVLIAGDRAASMGILPCSKDDVKNAVLTAANSWMRIRGLGKYEIQEDPVALVRCYVLPRLGKAFREVGPDRKPFGKMAYAEAGWFNEHFYFLRPVTIRALVKPKARFDKDLKGLAHAFCRALENAGALVRGGAENSMQIRMADSIESGARVYMLRREVIDELETDE